jgi:ribose/xylose/arabinose/galactoside ABC-type transport system permease subunit
LPQHDPLHRPNLIRPKPGLPAMTRPAPSLWLERYGTCAAGAILFLFFALFAPNFLALQNLANIVERISFMAILGIGFALALLVAELDLSFANI